MTDNLETSSLSLACQQAEQELVTIRDFIRFCVTQLNVHDVFIAQGTTDPFAEAVAMVMNTLSLSWSADEQILDSRLISAEKHAVLALLQERINTRQPLSYLIILAYFCGLPFYVDERVLIPRSPIAELIKAQFAPYFAPAGFDEFTDFDNELGELLDDNILANGLPAKFLPAPERMLDLCTGSGCIAIALATYFPDAMVDASDLDKEALEVSAVNVEHHALNNSSLEHQINLFESDLFAKLPADNQYDLIVTNPPYVDAEAMAELPPEFEHEPAHALQAGQDGLDLVHRILNDAPDYLSENGLLVCEVGDSEWHLRQAYPQIDFHWLVFEHGGHGVFAITRNELMAHREAFAKMVST